MYWHCCFFLWSNSAIYCGFCIRNMIKWKKRVNSRTEYERDKQNLIEIKRGISGSEGKEKRMGGIPWNCSCGDECGR